MVSQSVWVVRRRRKWIRRRRQRRPLIWCARSTMPRAWSTPSPPSDGNASRCVPPSQPKTLSILMLACFLSFFLLEIERNCGRIFYLLTTNCLGFCHNSLSVVAISKNSGRGGGIIRARRRFNCGGNRLSSGQSLFAAWGSYHGWFMDCYFPFVNY